MYKPFAVIVILITTTIIGIAIYAASSPPLQTITISIPAKYNATEVNVNVQDDSLGRGLTQILFGDSNGKLFSSNTYFSGDAEHLQLPASVSITAAEGVQCTISVTYKNTTTFQTSQDNITVIQGPYYSTLGKDTFKVTITG